jgi:hypothetical protein
MIVNLEYKRNNLTMSVKSGTKVRKNFEIAKKIPDCNSLKITSKPRYHFAYI